MSAIDQNVNTGLFREQGSVILKIWPGACKGAP